MCGIVGVVSSKGARPPDRGRLELAVQALRHRGPDGSGIHLGADVGLGHTRLGIIDLEGGSQPMSNDQASVWTVYNGEIWNFAELRRELEFAGHRFATRCDTEVLIHGYEEWGDAIVSRLNGMFAFAIWDAARRRLLLARDRIGKKPLYVSELDHGVAFGSDVRSVLLASGGQPRLDEERIPEFLFQRYVGAPRTLFRGVERLPPGHILIYESGRIERRSFWMLPDDPDPEPLPPQRLRELLRDSVHLRLMSDVPVGVFLSGGVDSAAVLGLMNEAGAGQVASFTIGFDDPIFDERRVARLTAQRFGTDHNEIVVSRDDFLETLPQLAWFRDEPIAEPAEIPLLLLARFAARQVKVVLSGEGGDELFGGYPKYRAERLLSLPTGAPRLALRTAVSLASRRRTHRQLERALETLALRDELLRWASWFRAFSSADLMGGILTPRLASLATPELLTARLASLLRPYSRVDPARRMLIGDLLTYLPDNMLLRGDRVLMAASVEGRMPLLDHRIVEHVVRAPASQRAGWRASKRVLRDAVADLIPPEVLTQPKRGFPVPVARFLVDGRDRLIDRLLLSERTLDRGLFDRSALADTHRGRACRTERLGTPLVHTCIAGALAAGERRSNDSCSARITGRPRWPAPPRVGHSSMTEPLSPESVRLLYVGGTGRSGSTLLERMLAVNPECFAAGELRYIWERGFRDNLLCSCGEPFRQCEFWQAVESEGFGRLEGAQLERILNAVESIRRFRFVPWLAMRRPRSKLAELVFPDVEEALVKLYRAIAAVSGCSVIVDSSKDGPYAFVLDAIPALNMSLVHLVRDSRAVAYSWRRRKLRPEITDTPTFMPQFPAGRTAYEWVLYNLAFEFFGLRRQSYMRVRYEDLVVDPASILSRVSAFAGFDPALPQQKRTGDASVPPPSLNHSVSGNPIRFVEEPLRIRPDVEWREAMPVGSRALVTAITLPLLARYRYLRNTAGRD